ncbi:MULTISPECIES: DNA cytosine methyltransferase [unclassified Halomonas]|uniref:DNA cytosine methyltransferase n=1 Tax=unclassified Halomonas TaxID=2609666 RepID=UPI0007D8E97D|nr:MULTISPECIES: DNA cytosine methyltransferase [unclassified Halomonas]MBT2784793.1 DNA cytosine methyltransferase [Halomonas sp. ISL-106]MBT2796487.1 DNA cytosine methyltransferase [Halomonas sp. ISL-104]OAL59735.1 DNA (cytosine-5-)-methyltransferase [Halomonas sp. ALS9]
MIEAVDLFCGAGGLTAGLRQAGVTVRAGYDIEESCRFAYEHNNHAKFIRQDVGELTGDHINSWYQDPDTIRLLAGCAPCQPFSTYNQGKDVTKDKKWPLLGSFARLIKEAKPELVTMENVPTVTKHKIYHDFVSSLKSEGYYVWADTVKCVEYGLPQNRRRHVLLASKLGSIELMPPTHAKLVTVRETIGDLEPIFAGYVSPNDPLHKTSKLSKINMERIRHSQPGGTWRDWPEELRAACHVKQSGKSYPAVYGRMEWDKPSPTMTTLCFGYGNGRFGHPEQDRAITLREAALLQSFPKDYKFASDGEQILLKPVGIMIGNAVPVRLAKIIGESFKKHITNL